MNDEQLAEMYFDQTQAHAGVRGAAPQEVALRAKFVRDAVASPAAMRALRERPWGFAIEAGDSTRTPLSEDSLRRLPDRGGVARWSLTVRVPHATGVVVHVAYLPPHTVIAVSFVVSTPEPSRG